MRRDLHAAGRRCLSVSCRREAGPQCWNGDKPGQKLDNYWTTKCTACVLKSKCPPAKERRVKRWEHEAVLDAMREQF